MHAQVVNLGGLVQADSVQNVNGVIELVASGSLNLASGSTVSASAGSIALHGNVINQDGTIQADAGTIALHGKVINQNGTVQADSVKNINGTIELMAD